MSRQLNELFDAWNRLGLRWCLLRDHATLDVEGADGTSSAPSRSDIDVLVSPADIATACSASIDHGFTPLRSYGRGSHRFYVAYDRANDAWLELDFVTELSFGAWQELFLSPAEPLLASRVPVNSGWALAPSDRFWALLVHCLLDKRTFPQRHAAALSQSPPVDGGCLASRILDAWRGWSAEHVQEATQANDWAELIKLGPPLATALRRRDLLGTARRVVFGRSLRAIERPLQARARRGAAVAVVGPDGAGKSTLSEGIARHFYFPARIIYLGMWQNESPSTLIVSLGRIARRPLKVWSGYLTGTRDRLLGKLVLFDRYTYDALIPPKPPLVRLKVPYFWLLARLCPPPDMVLLLDAPGSVMFRRKGEFDPHHLDNERRHFLQLRSRLHNVHVLDATQPAAAVRADATAVIWSWYTARMRGAGAGSLTGPARQVRGSRRK